MIYSDVKKHKVSVVIPVYNNASFIGDAIESVLCQTLRPIEIIVVNDGSTDNTSDILEKCSKRIICIQQENRGPASARNNGIRNSKGDFIAFLDSDDMWMPNKLGRQMELFRDIPSAALVYSRFSNFCDKTGNDLCLFPKKVHSGALFNTILNQNPILLSTVVIKTSILLDMGGFDEGLFTAEDIHLYLRIAKTYTIVGAEDVLVRRRRHEDNLSSKVDVKIGTLDCLDRIVYMFPDTNPKNYLPMREAYLNRGKALMLDYFYHAKYSSSNRTALRLLKQRLFNPLIFSYFFLTILPRPLIELCRSIKKLFSKA
jgi:glycosyltransferase involved in cell wall biosynthesis